MRTLTILIAGLCLCLAIAIGVHAEAWIESSTEWTPALPFFTNVGRIAIVNDLEMGRRLFKQYNKEKPALIAAPLAQEAVKAEALERLSEFVETVKNVDPALYTEAARRCLCIVTPKVEPSVIKR